MNDLSIYRDIARRRREPTSVTYTRRFVRRAREHGVEITEPVYWAKHYAIIRHGDRFLRIDLDGTIVQSSAHKDPQWRANFARLHAHALALARRFRLRGQTDRARRALSCATEDRASCAVLP